MTRRPLTLGEVNALSPAAFAEHFAGVLEHSPHYAVWVAGQRPFASGEALADSFRQATERDSEDAQLRLIRAHPDLAGKAALAGELSPESAHEQASAGLGHLSAEEYAEFHRLNAAYHEKFDFPYVVCVREHNKESIFAGARRRLSHTPDEERRAALHEISRIARYRVLDLLRATEEDPMTPPPTKVRVRLGENNYGKAEVNLMKVWRGAARHEIREVQVRVGMYGDFEAAHVQGDNSGLVATDTVRNTVYGLAKEGFGGSVERFGQELVRHFCRVGPRVTGAFAEFTEHLWERVQVSGPDGVPRGHDHSFVRQMPKRTARVESVDGGQTFRVQGGLRDLCVLKTTASGWAGYLLDERFTTLPETTDRIMATSVTAKWDYAQADGDHDAVWERVYRQLQVTLTDHYSPSLQRTLYLMGEAVLGACPEITRIWFQMPNRHHLRYDLGRFGLENDGEIFHVDPEPYGLMEAWVERE